MECTANCPFSGIGYRPFAWRKKRERDWGAVKYCPDRCGAFGTGFAPRGRSGSRSLVCGLGGLLSKFPLCGRRLAGSAKRPTAEHRRQLWRGCAGSSGT
ncbi:DUF2256 domain-containing protein [Sphingomonas sp. LR60]|uniref:DUF2256 domain-containing protein n=1 Tax=Sphingomonas sp. LR60 TaxID=3050233 RepID=UPI003FA7182F